MLVTSWHKRRDNKKLHLQICDFKRNQDVTVVSQHERSTQKRSGLKNFSDDPDLPPCPWLQNCYITRLPTNSQTGLGFSLFFHVLFTLYSEFVLNVTAKRSNHGTMPTHFLTLLQAGSLFLVFNCCVGGPQNIQFGRTVTRDQSRIIGGEREESFVVFVYFLLD